MKRLPLLVPLISLILLGHNGCERTAPQKAGTKSRVFALKFERLKDDGEAWGQGKELDPQRLGIVVVDVWDKHWCKAHTERVSALAKRMEPFLTRARKLGFHILFGPSGTLNVYKDHPARLRVLSSKKYEAPKILTRREFLHLTMPQRLKRSRPYFPEDALFASKKSRQSQLFAPLPPWAQSGGCEDGASRPCPQPIRNVWTRQNSVLTIQSTDAIVNLDDPHELYNYVRSHEITHLLYVGTASNMCITWTREGSLINMMARGVPCAFVEELTIAITGNGYDPDKRSPDKDLNPKLGTQRVNRHIKTFIAPSVSAEQILEQDLKGRKGS